ncbi:MAG: hypothetical protein K2J94_07280 [Duncaniella sp.]|nr:hypothetical protein [Duncaniella sp.]
MKRLPLILLPVILLLMAVNVDGRSPKRGAVGDGDAAKADYMYLEALRAKSQGCLV